MGVQTGVCESCRKCRAVRLQECPLRGFHYTEVLGKSLNEHDLRVEVKS